MSKISQAFGIAMIAGAGAIASQIEPIETTVDNALGDAKAYMQTQLGINEEQALELGLGGALLLSLLGAGAIASGTRNRMRANEPSKNSTLESNISQINTDLNDIKFKFENMDNAIVLLERRMLDPIGIDADSVERVNAAITQIDEKTTELIHKFDPQGLGSNFTAQKMIYETELNEFYDMMKNMLEDHDGWGDGIGSWPEELSAIIGAVNNVNTTVQSEIIKSMQPGNTSMMDNIQKAEKEAMSIVSEKLGHIRNETDGFDEFSEIIMGTAKVCTAASNLIASYYLLQLKIREQQLAANSIKSDIPSQQMHEDIDHNMPVLG